MLRVFTALVPLTVAIVAAIAWRPVLELELLGWDTYPMIAAGRVSSAGELTATFGEELMDGRYPLGHFWRPMAHLLFAADHALWGLEPRGYHRTDLGLLALAAALVALLSLRLFRIDGAAGRVGAAVAGLAFALHPLQFEVLPVAARRADSLALVFTLAALLLQQRRERTGGLAWSFAAGVACAAALASKESGALAVALVVALELVRGRGRAVELLRASWPSLALTALALGGRSAVLGGLGGSEQSSLGAGFARAPELALVYGEALVFPRTVVDVPSPGGWALAAAGVLAALALVLSRRSRADGARDDARLGPAGAVLLLVLWALLALVITGTSGVMQGWYAFPLLAAWALALGLTTGLGIEAVRRGPRPAGAAALVLVLGCTAVGAAGSMLFDPARDFQEASRIQRAFLERFERRLSKASGGRTISVGQSPYSLTAIDGRGMERVIFMFGPYSLEAWADLRFGEGYARVGFPGLPSTRPPAAGRLDVVVQPVRLGFR